MCQISDMLDVSDHVSHVSVGDVSEASDSISEAYSEYFRKVSGKPVCCRRQVGDSIAYSTHARITQHFHDIGDTL